MLRFRKRTLVLLAAAVAAVVAAFGAYAYWTSGGTGTGSAQTTTTADVTVNQTSASSGLYPGGSVALSGDFDNPNAFPVYISSVTASVDSFSAQADLSKDPCTEADFFISGSAPVGAQVAAGSAQGAWSGLALEMTNSGANQDNCKSITVPITYTANP
jgi:hypothetical protein